MIDLGALEARIKQHGAVVRVVVAGVQGSAPRAPGAAMQVWAGGFEGTIGGGQLEWVALEAARKHLTAETPGALQRLSLGPGLGQCCGGAVTLALWRWDAEMLLVQTGLRRTEIDGAVALPMPDATAFSDTLRRSYARRVAEGAAPLIFEEGWLIEPKLAPKPRAVIHGAGHVGLALARVLGLLPDYDVVVMDRRAELTEDLPPGACKAEAAHHAALIGASTAQDIHFVLTHSHELDLEICHQLLRHGQFAQAGLIGSDTKWVRFQTRLRALGHGDAEIARITCPIGDPALGKAPHAIAIGVAARLLSHDL